MVIQPNNIGIALLGHLSPASHMFLPLPLRKLLVLNLLVQQHEVHSHLLQHVLEPINLPGLHLRIVEQLRSELLQHLAELYVNPGPSLFIQFLRRNRRLDSRVCDLLNQRVLMKIVLLFHVPHNHREVTINFKKHIVLVHELLILLRLDFNVR